MINEEDLKGETYSSVLRKDILLTKKKGENLNAAEKRIIMDVEEFESKVDPSQGISALPLRSNIYEWHANVKGYEDTPYENGVFHFVISLPKDYPNSPPKILAKTGLLNGFFNGYKFSSPML
jgi:hypothetical protein